MLKKCLDQGLISDFFNLSIIKLSPYVGELNLSRKKVVMV